jgi:hypothetical protein
MADRAFIARSTLLRVEQGDPTVSIGIYATVLFILGMAERLSEIASASNDTLSRSLEEEFLPQRIREQRQPK